MKAKVLIRFRDKHTGEMHKVNDVIEVSKSRFAEILEVGPLVEKVEETAEVEETATEVAEAAAKPKKTTKSKKDVK